MIDAMTILGNPDQCRDQMNTFFAAGVTEIRLVLNEPDKDAYIRAIQALALSK